MAKKPKASPEFQDLMLVSSPANHFFLFSDLVEIKLPDWPPAFTNNPTLKANWDKAEKEAQRHKNNLLSLRIWSPYPILSYCLGEVEIRQTRLQLCFLLFPTTVPKKLTHAVTQIIFEIPLDEASGSIERCWMDTLKEYELSEENKRHIRQLQDKQKQEVPGFEHLGTGGKK